MCTPPKKGKGFPYSIPSVGPGADPGVQAVSPQVTVSHPHRGLLSTRPVVTSPASEHHRPLAGTKLYCLVTEAHRCEQLAQGCYAASPRAGFELETCWSQAQTPYPLHHRTPIYYTPIGNLTVLVLLNHFEYINCQTCPGPATFRPFGPLSNTRFYLSPHPKQHFEQFSRFCTSHSRHSLYFTMGRPFPPLNCPLERGSGPHLIHGSVASLKSTPKQHLDRFSNFLEGSRLCQIDRETSYHATHL